MLTAVSTIYQVGRRVTEVTGGLPSLSSLPGA